MCVIAIAAASALVLPVGWLIWLSYKRDVEIAELRLALEDLEAANGEPPNAVRGPRRG